MGAVDTHINNLYKIFKTVFSMQDLKNEFKGDTSLLIFGGGRLADEASEFFGQEIRAVSPDFQENDKGAVKLVFLDPAQISETFLSSGFFADPAKTVCVISASADDVRHSEINALFSLKNLHLVLWEHGSLDKVLKFMTGKLGNTSHVLAKNCPPLRPLVADQLIARVSRENTGISFVSSIPSGIPIIGIVAGLFAVTGETVILTANQLRLCLRIAGLYGYDLDFFTRIAEIWPVIAGAFGWKTLARAAVGYIPAAGPVLKASIAFAGTRVCGEVAKIYYSDSKLPNGDEVKKLYEKYRKSFSKKAGNMFRKKKN